MEVPMDVPGGQLWLDLALILVLIVLNGFFSLSEMGILRASSGKLKEFAEEGDRRAKQALRLRENQAHFLSVMEVGSTLTGFLAAGVSVRTLVRPLGIFLTGKLPYPYEFSFAIIVLLFSLLILLFGEHIPKRMALQRAHETALTLAGPVTFFSKLFTPVVWFQAKATNLFLLLTGNYSRDVEKSISEEEIRTYLKVGQEHGVINATGEEMMVNIMDFDDKLAYEIMTPRTNIFMLDYDDFGTEWVEELLNSGFSRAPVYRDSLDNVVGTVYIKDIFVEYFKNDFKSLELDKVMKEPYFVPETKNVDKLLTELQTTRNYVAILIDEYGGFSGMVTMEDIVEEIVGEIEDEFDEDVEPIRQVGPYRYILDGYMEIDDVNDQLNLDLNSDNHETISGLFIEQLGFIPEEEDKKRYSVSYNDHILLTELGVKDNRITGVQVDIVPEESDEE
ncbi:MAG: hemolysin family protein [Tissierellia bacterium]|nr:hemolysin family protein [Tissierellia bacterium]